MGIPSYYKRLSNTIKGLVVHHRNDGSFKADILLFDFNCMIYQVIRGSGIKPYPGHQHPDADQWETDVCQAVVDYTVKVWQELGKPKTVFLGLDGVVPMAKIKQQRMRRFKSIWTAAEERSRGIRDATENQWDTNAITPGTAFMEKLGARLAQLCKVHNWTLSDTNQQGEGEQKCMKFWRDHHPLQGNVVIYGLDADLILLCLLTQQLLDSTNQVWCFRETADWEGGKDKGLAEFMRLSINKLQETLRNQSIPAKQWTMDYVAAMSFLGNDFVPHGLSMKIREGGHDRLVRDLRKLHASGKTLTAYKENQESQESKGWTYIPESLLELTQGWRIDEEKMILEFIKNKAMRMNHEDWQMTPCEWKVEEKLLCQTRGKLWFDWETRMVEGWFGPGVQSEFVCQKYVEGLQWILDYYTQQRPVDTLWIYPWGLPPTWQMVQTFLARHTDALGKAPELTTEPPIQPSEQLAMVLPLESWSLIRSPNHRLLPSALPHYWPTKYGFFSAAKTFMWECEAEIPLLHVAMLRSVCKKV